MSTVVMKNEQGMSEIAKIETRFLAWARAHGLTHKVAGDTAYSSRAMGMGRYAKLVSAKGGRLLIAVDGKRVTFDIQRKTKRNQKKEKEK